MPWTAQYFKLIDADDLPVPASLPSAKYRNHSKGDLSS
jgi:hypothetical protein